MELEKHVVSLDLALALRENGYPQENALFYWYRQEEYYGAGMLQPAGEPFLDRYEAEPSFPIKRLAAAPLASELMDLLPKSCPKHGHPKLDLCFGFGKYLASYYDATYAPTGCEGVGEDDTAPNALARLFLHLRKASLI